jgi:hypothetical protein
LDAEHVGEGAVNGRSSGLTGTGVGPHPTMVPPIERGNSVTNEGGSGFTSKDDGEGEEVLNAEDHVVYDAITDPELPPHTRLEKAKMVAQALAKGDPNTVSAIKQLVKGKLQGFQHSLAKATSGSGSAYTN